MVVPGQCSQSQLMVVADRAFLLGGNAETAIFAMDQQIAYVPTDAAPETYKQATRIGFPSTDNADEPYLALGFPWWKTNYST